MTEQTRWNEWRSFVHQQGELDRLRATFEKADGTIETALDLVLARLEAVLAVQERAGGIREELDSLELDLKALLEEERRGTLLDESPPMLSTKFFSQFKNRDMWSAVIKAPEEIIWLQRGFLDRYGWIVSLQIILSIFLMVSIYRNRKLLHDKDRWRFIAARPISAGFFLGYMTTVLIYEYLGDTPAIWKLGNTVVAAISFARLIGSLTEITWKKHFVNGLLVVTITSRLMDVLSFPLPIFRLYTVFAALAGLLFCWHLAGKSMQNRDTNHYRWLLRLVAIFFASIIFVELWGHRSLASHLFISMVRSLATVLVFMLFMYMIRGVLEWLFRNSLIQRASVIDSDDSEIIIKRLARFIDIAIVGLILLPAILMIWGVYDSLPGATKGLLSLGFSLGSVRIDLGLLLVSLSILYGSFFASWLTQKLLVDEVIVKRRLERGVRLSMARLAHYAIILTGFLVALSTLGFEISKITIMLSALGVGIGFGLQGIVNNFVSGLILLFERPIRVGDVIQVTGDWAEIKQIGIRATTVLTFDHADRIIPNATLISNEVTNWTLSNRQIRLIIPVGVAYGSDVTKVTETLLGCAKTNPKVAKRPEPKALFLNFGESTLDFELRVYVADFNHRIEVRSALNHQIDRSFRAANIEIAFPQRDLHLRGLDESALLRSARPQEKDSGEPLVSTESER